ncbi:MAG: tetratricopeptide repeat protein [Polyangiales bacterium]
MATGHGAGGSAHDDFVYHLHRGSSLLLKERVGDAKEELERALALQPRDAKSQDLLAGVYYRLGLYPRAIRLWSGLVRSMPKEPTLRVNLALVLFKTGQADAAREHIDAALAIAPQHKRAWGYLGLIHWRQGQIQEAHAAFVRAEQHSMARRMEEALEKTTPGSIEAPPMDHLDEHDRAAMRGAAEEALDQLGALSVEPSTRRQKRSGAWEAVEPGEESFAPPPRLKTLRPIDGPRSLASFLGAWSVALDPGQTMACVDGALHVQSESDVCLRLGHLTSVRGELETIRIPTGKGDSLGGVDPLWRLTGPVDVITRSVHPEIHVVDIGEQVFYVEESRILGFDATLEFEVAELPLGDDEKMVIQFQGQGAVAFGARSPKVLSLNSGEELRIRPERLVAWSGRLFPSGGRGTSPYSAAAPRLVLRGEGYVVVD